MMSSFEPFTLALANGGTLTGKVFIPESSTSARKRRPLVVLLHGGRCHSGYFDVDRNNTAFTMAHALSMPVVSIDRPCYGGTSTVFPIPEHSSFHRESGKWEHEYIFPALWKTYGLPNQCSAIVAMSHSMGTPGLFVAASLHAQATTTVYPLAGLIVSGWGCRPNADSQQAWIAMSAAQKEANRHLVMLSDRRLNTAEEHLRTQIPEQTVPGPPEENAECVSGPWIEYFPGIAAKIDVPIMFAVGEHDWLWEGTFEHVREFAIYFRSCPRFDGSVVLGAPHAIEWSHCSYGWYPRCFGFAIEVAAHFELKNQSK